MRQIDQPHGHQMTHIVLRLPLAVHTEQTGAQQCGALLFGQRRPDDDVDIAGLVFERHKGHAPGRFRTLPHRDDAAAARQPAIGKSVQYFGRRKTHGRQTGAQQRQRMPAQRQTQMPVIGHDAGTLALFCQLHRRFSYRCAAQQAFIWHAGHGLPHGRTAVAAERQQRIG